MATDQMEAKLIDAGVRNLREFGYPACTAENILTDEIYSAFFKSMLADNKGKRADVDVAIAALETKIAANEPPAEKKPRRAKKGSR